MSSPFCSPTTQAAPIVLGSRGGAACCGGRRTGASGSYVDPGKGPRQGLNILKSRFPYQYNDGNDPSGGQNEITYVNT